MLLEVLICTIDARIAQVADLLLPEQSGVCYLVSWQQSQAAHGWATPAALAERPDVRVVTCQGKGISRNRNHAFQHARGNLLLLADDDARLEAKALQAVVAYFEQQPQVDVVATCVKRGDGRWHKAYPKHSFDFRQMPRAYYVSSVELFVRHTARLPRFDERFGLGSSHLASGEEDVFVADCSRAGLTAVFLPLHTATLTGTLTTGNTFDTNAKVRRSKGAVLAYLHGACGAWLRSVKFVLCYQGVLARWRVFKDLVWGIHYITHSSQ